MTAILCPSCGALLIVGSQQLDQRLVCTACAFAIAPRSRPLTEEEVMEHLRKERREKDYPADS